MPETLPEQVKFEGLTRSTEPTSELSSKALLRRDRRSTLTKLVSVSSISADRLLRPRIGEEIDVDEDEDEPMGRAKGESGGNCGRD